MKPGWSRGFIVGALLLAAPAAFGAAAKSEVDLAAPDGVRLKASYFAASQAGPGILLLHMCGGATRTSWDGLALALAERGFHVLTLDYRGFGESGGERFETLDRAARRASEARWAKDLEVAYDYLVTRPGVDRRRSGAGGASCGVDNALRLALAHPEIVSLAFLSGGASREGVDFILRTPGLALFLAASEDDRGFVPYMRWLSRFSANPASRLVEYTRAGHGTDMFAAQKDLEPALVAFFAATLGSPPATPAGSESKPNEVTALWRILTGPDGPDRARPVIREARARDAKAVLLPEVASVLLGQDHLRAGQVQEAIAVMRLGLEETPDSIDLNYSLASVYDQSSRPAQAIEHLEKALDLLAKRTTLTAEEKASTRQALEERLRQLKAKL